MKIRDKVMAQVIEWRRYFHKYPELSNNELNTSQFIFDTLKAFPNLELSRPTPTSVIAILKGTHSSKIDPIIAFRADIDALPIQEKNNIEYKSTKPGIMHACGHDAHAAILLGAAKVLSHKKDKIKGEIRFVFQHSEEVLPGGAKELVEKGVLENVDMAFALHVSPNERSGTFSIKKGVMYSSEDYFKIRVIGSGGHASTPEFTIDPLVIGAEIVSNIQHIISRKVSILKAPVISITKFNCGNALNIIAEEAVLEGTIRSIDEDIRQEVKVHLDKIVSGITAAHGATNEVIWTQGHSTVINNEKAFDISKSIIEKVVGSENVISLEEPLFAAEDFAAISNKVPSSMQLIGVYNEDLDNHYPLHHPRFQIDENSLQYGVEYFVGVAEKICIQEHSVSCPLVGEDTE